MLIKRCDIEFRAVLSIEVGQQVVIVFGSRVQIDDSRCRGSEVSSRQRFMWFLGFRFDFKRVFGDYVGSLCLWRWVDCGRISRVRWGEIDGRMRRFFWIVLFFSFLVGVVFCLEVFFIAGLGVFFRFLYFRRFFYFSFDYSVCYCLGLGLFFLLVQVWGCFSRSFQYSSEEV